VKIQQPMGSFKIYVSRNGYIEAIVKHRLQYHITSTANKYMFPHISHAFEARQNKVNIPKRNSDMEY